MVLFDIHTHNDHIVSDDDVPDSSSIIAILNTYPLEFEYAKDNATEQYFSCGVHPWYSEDAQPQVDFLKEIANHPAIVAIGEAGYDKLKGPSLEVQQHIFEQQVELSELLQKPLIIHCVKAWDQLLASQKKLKPKQKWIIHGYRDKPSLTQQLLNHNFYFSCGEQFNEESIRIIPPNRLLCETDVQEVSISDVYNEITSVLDIPIDSFCQQQSENIYTIFGITQ